MGKRFFLIGMMVLLLVTGMISSAACEMTCTPVEQMAACCTHPSMGDKVEHCQNSPSLHLSGARQCGHPQESTALPTVTAQADQFHAVEIAGILTVLPVLDRGASHSFPTSSGGLRRSSFIAPLRI